MQFFYSLACQVFSTVNYLFYREIKNMVHQYFSRIFKRTLQTVLFTVCFFCSPATGQVHIAPTSLFLNDSNQTGRYIVLNNSLDPVEAEIELLYGYPHTNDDGEVFFKRYEQVPESEPSALEWIRAYPRHFIIEPGERQIVRLVARPPSGLPPGEYWVRPAIVTQTPFQIDTASLSEDITANINMRRRNILSLNYRRGQVQPDIQTGVLSAAHSPEGGVRIEADLHRKGNGAYLGHAVIRVFDNSNEMIYSSEREIAVYKDQMRAYHIPAEIFSPGEYTVEMELTTSKRKEVRLIHVPQVIDTTTVRIYC